MKQFFVLLMFGLVSACRPVAHSNPTVYKTAENADVVLLAEVRREGGKEQLITRQIIKGRFSPLFPVKVGERISPGLPFRLSTGPEGEQIESILLCYLHGSTAPENTCVFPVKKGRVVGLEGADAGIEQVIATIKLSAKPMAGTYSKNGSP